MSDLLAAQLALAGNDADAAARISEQLLERFPAYAAAWWLRGDIERARGDPPAAGRAYAAALTRNPRLPDAWLGLGLLAEEHGRLDDAVAYCQVAWELAPARTDLRGTLERLAEARYGVGGALELSRPALAALHLEAGRFRRAAREYDAALADLPERLDLRLGLAEALWRLGYDDDAAAICAKLLQLRPEAAPALLVLADVERRRGAHDQSNDLARRLAAVDPDGALVAAAVARYPDSGLSWLVSAGRS